MNASGKGNAVLYRVRRCAIDQYPVDIQHKPRAEMQRRGQLQECRNELQVASLSQRQLGQRRGPTAEVTLGVVNAQALELVDDGL